MSQHVDTMKKDIIKNISESSLSEEEKLNETNALLGIFDEVNEITKNRKIRK